MGSIHPLHCGPTLVLPVTRRLHDGAARHESWFVIEVQLSPELGGGAAVQALTVLGPPGFQRHPAALLQAATLLV